MGATKKRRTGRKKAHKGPGGKHGRRDKVIRDSFTIPEAEHALLKTLKARCLAGGMAVKKSELLRAGLATLDSMSESRLLAALARIERVKTGRPPKSGEDETTTLNEGTNGG